MRLELSSKVDNLQNLQGMISNGKILPLIRFLAFEYELKSEEIFDSCLSFNVPSLIIRSSSSHEDKETMSCAGKYDSVLNVPLKKEAIEKAILSVRESLTDLSDKDEIFIQPMLENVVMSGVIFTADIDTLAPYYIINYETSGSTVGVTSGNSKNIETYISYKNEVEASEPFMYKLITASKECEKIFSNQFLDIEFAFTEDTLYILQVRAIVVDKKEDLSSLDLSSSLSKLYKKIKKLNTSHPKLLGNKSIFGVMPDWNPAEIIGIKPKQLSLSLYKELITDNIWAYQRDNYGYRSLRSFPLLVSFLGMPYIDVRVSFNSFIPKELNEDIATKLVEYYLSRLSENSNYHDKIEFKVVFSCCFFGISNKMKILENHNFSNNEIEGIRELLLSLTNKVININHGLYKKDLNKIELLKVKYNEIVKSNLSIIDKIYWLIEDCKRFGTLPFAGIARAAFIAIQFLNSMVEEEVITKKELNQFLNTIQTVSKEMSLDKNILDKKEFLLIYGHLRPGTYDILSKRYDESYDEYFSDEELSFTNETFEFSLKQKEKIENLIKENELDTSFEELITFIKESITGREYAKFIFTRSLSEVLRLTEELGKRVDINKEDLAYLDFQVIKDLYSSIDYREVSDIFNININKNKEFYRYTKAVKLPSLIINENDIYKFFLSKEEPSYVTLKVVKAKVVDISEIDTLDYQNKIICIQSADPGYDYLFSKNIAGLITCYGGSNSHMTIRCAELGIPAVIGCGVTYFNKYRNSNFIEINAMNRQVKVIS